MLQIQNFSVSVDNKTIFDDLSFSFKSGNTYALMGPNGSGKSTLACSLLGHPAYRVNNGLIELNNHDISSLPADERVRRGLFVAFQYPQSIPGLQVFDFLRESYRAIVGAEIDTKALQANIFAAFDQVGLDHSFLYRCLNDGFSGGEKKRLEVAQLLLFKPKVAILDEIDSGLDIDGIKQIAQALIKAQTENPQMVLVLITHYQRILQFLTPDEVFVLVNGRIVAHGNADLAREVEEKGYDGFR